MHGEYVLLLLVIFGSILFIIQRSEARRRRGVAMVMALFGVSVVWYISTRQVWGEAMLAFAISVILNAMFWLFIGRYNPVGSSDSIRVLGMDD